MKLVFPVGTIDFQTAPPSTLTSYSTLVLVGIQATPASNSTSVIALDKDVVAPVTILEEEVACLRSNGEPEPLNRILREDALH